MHEHVTYLWHKLSTTDMRPEIKQPFYRNLSVTITIHMVHSYYTFPQCLTCLT